MSKEHQRPPPFPARDLSDAVSWLGDAVTQDEASGVPAWGDGKPLSWDEVYALAQTCVETLRLYEQDATYEGCLLAAWRERRRAWEAREAAERLQRYGSHPNERPPANLRQRVLARQGGVCGGCGATCSKGGRPLELHRIVPGRQGGRYRLDNVVALCQRCHRKQVPR